MTKGNSINLTWEELRAIVRMAYVSQYRWEEKDINEERMDKLRVWVDWKRTGIIPIIENGDSDILKKLKESQIQNDFSPTDKERWELYEEGDGFYHNKSTVMTNTYPVFCRKMDDAVNEGINAGCSNKDLRSQLNASIRRLTVTG